MKVLMWELLDKPDTSIVVNTTPSKVDYALKRYGWSVAQECLAESRVEYISKYFTEFKIIMKWDGWTGKVEVMATHLKNEDTLTEDLKQGLEKVLATTYSVVEYRDCDLFDVDAFIENQGWELYRATCIFQPGWCHYIYGNDNYPDRRLILAWKLDNKLAALWTMDSDMVEDEPSYEEYNL